MQVSLGLSVKLSALLYQQTRSQNAWNSLYNTKYMANPA